MQCLSVCPLLSLSLSSPLSLALSLPSGIHDSSNEDKLFFLLINIPTRRAWQAGSTSQELGWTGRCVWVLRVCVWMQSVCDSPVVSMVPRRLSKSAWDAPFRPEPSRLCVTRPLSLPPRRAPPPPSAPCLISSPTGGDAGLGAAFLPAWKCWHAQAGILSLGTISPPSLFLPSFPSPFVCCLNYASSQSRK